ncbi:MAG: outer membrane protein assembly factor BamC [Methylomonas sp.]|jgi:outer membrane protein assembly factor BamC
MKSLKFLGCGFVWIILTALPGCTFVKSLFPDKERDYQFHTEVPDLIIPDDLKPHPVTSPRVSGLSSTLAPPAVTASNPVPAPDPRQTPTPADKPQPAPHNTSAAKKPVKVEVGNADVSSLQIDQPKMQSWRLVAKALSKQRIEIVERNLDNTYFFVKYDPNAVKPKDNTFWDEMKFLFGEDPSNEQEYRVNLTEINPDNTQITIQDMNGQTLSTPAATNLLKLITDGVNMDTAPGGEGQEKPAPQ